MIRTRVGYAGGTNPNPTYNNIGDYTETVQIDYDPTRVSYEDLLTIFWKSYDPVEPYWGRQYASIIFYHNAEQQRLANESKIAQGTLSSAIPLDILPAPKFYIAEDYHQKYYLRMNGSLAKELTAIYPDPKDFINSTAAARLNGYAGGYGDIEILKAQLTDYGLSAEGQQKLLDIAGKGLAQVCPAF